MKPEAVNILVVDADQSSASWCADILASKGYHVTTAHSPDAALSQVKGETCHLVITEIVFPDGKTGEDLIRRIDDLHREIGVLILTAHATLESVTNAMHLGVLEYLVKPVEEAKLLEAVIRSLARLGICQISDQAIHQAVGTRVRRFRQARAMTGQALSLRVGVTQSQISQIETGRSAASVVTLWKIAQVLGVSLSEMLEGA